IGSRLTLGVAAAVTDDVTLRSRLVLQLDREVVESGLFIVEPNVAVLVKLPRRCRQGPNIRRARERVGTTRIQSHHFNACCPCLASAGVHRNRGRTLSTRNGSGRNRPAIGLRSWPATHVGCESDGTWIGRVGTTHVDRRTWRRWSYAVGTVGDR